MKKSVLLFVLLTALLVVYNLSRADSHDEFVRVTEVIDGDTIRVNYQGDETSVRLIGIDTPETHGRGGLKECYGEEASQFTKQLLPEGTKVELEKDKELYDRYGRTLAYVYKSSDQTFVNLQIAKAGYADELRIEPNVKFSGEIRTAVENAKTTNLGLWKACGNADVKIN